MSLTPGQTTLGAIRLAAKQRANMENSNFLSTSEWNSNINLSWYELYDLLIQKYGDNYYSQTPYTFTTDGTSRQFALPADFYKLLGVDLATNNTSQPYITLKPFNFGERNKVASPNINVLNRGSSLKYKPNGNNLMFNMVPSAGQTIQIWYAPRLTALVNDNDVVDGVSGWEEYIIVDSAKKALGKEESETAGLERAKDALIKRIESAAENRDAGSPATVSDTRDDGYCGDIY